MSEDERPQFRVESQYPSVDQLQQGLPMRWKVAIVSGVVLLASGLIAAVASSYGDDFRSGWNSLDRVPGTSPAKPSAPWEKVDLGTFPVFKGQ